MVLLTGAAASLLSGCGGNPPPAPSPVSTAVPHTPTSRPAPGLGISVQGAVPLGTAPIVDLTMWSHYVAWAREGGPNLVPLSIEVFDTQTGKTRTLVANSSATQEVSAVQGDGDLVVYTEANPTDESHTTWRIHLISLTQGSNRVLAQSSAGVPIPFVPQVALGGTCLAWSEPSATAAEGGAARLVIYDAATSARRVVPGVQNPDSVNIDSGSIYFAADDAAGRDGFTVPCTGSPAVKQLTTSGKVSQLSARGGVLAWQQPLQGDPDSIWAETVGGAAPGTPVQLTNVGNQGDVIAGKGVVAWLDRDGQLTVRDAAGRFPAVPLPHQDHLSIPARWSFLDATVAWVNGEGSGGDQLVLYRATAAVGAG